MARFTQNCHHSASSRASAISRRLAIMTANSQSDSAIQRDAEGAIVAALAAKLGVTLVSGGTLPLSGGVTIQLDARSEDGKFAVEAYARQGVLRGGQLKKIAQDVLKLALLRREPDFAGAAHHRVR